MAEKYLITERQILLARVEAVERERDLWLRKALADGLRVAQLEEELLKLRSPTQEMSPVKATAAYEDVKIFVQDRWDARGVSFIGESGDYIFNEYSLWCRYYSKVVSFNVTELLAELVHILPNQFICTGNDDAGKPTYQYRW